MAEAASKSLDSPDETRPIENGTVEVVNLGSGGVMRTTFQPGWRWSESVKPAAGTDSCQTHHFGYCISGHMHVVMDDGQELDSSQGHGLFGQKAAMRLKVCGDCQPGGDVIRPDIFGESTFEGFSNFRVRGIKHGSGVRYSACSRLFRSCVS